ncbi:MAG: DUF721 domain-containing protein [Phycisphaerales bacterium]|nr:DUF721 domain-containing protein [Phycisphaerales bacterium]
MDERERRKFEQLKAWRGPRPRDFSVATTIASIVKFEKKRNRDLGDVITVWNALCPAKLTSACTVSSLANGTLNVSASSPGAGYELSRLLRASLERELTSRFPTRVRRIKVVISETCG